jgi:uncharacterized membrane protein SpoIIM required for sporulation
MRQLGFEEKYASQWEELEALLREVERPRRRRRLDPEAMERLPYLYRQVCNHYALCRSRSYSPALESQLHDLVLRGHRCLYRRQGGGTWRLIEFIGVVFPRTLRRHARAFWLATALFLLPAMLLGGGCYSNPELIYSVLDDRQVVNMEEMYDPANRKPGRSPERNSETDLLMFGIYISNNIGIGFRTFAGGILFGVGTVLLLIFNGVVIGGVAGHLTRLGYGDTFWTFVSGHGAFELTAIVICGAAGLLLARALVAPGQLTRIDALKVNARDALKLVMGAALMLLLAAFVEAFWSSMILPAAVKYAAAGLFWLLVVLYLGFSGRSHGGSR